MQATWSVVLILLPGSSFSSLLDYAGRGGDCVTECGSVGVWECGSVGVWEGRKEYERE